MGDGRMADPDGLLEAVRRLHLAHPELGPKPLLAKLREQQPDLAAGNKEVREALAALIVCRGQNEHPPIPATHCGSLRLCGSPRLTTTHRGTPRLSATHRGTARHSAAQRGSPRHSAAQRGTARLSAAQRGSARLTAT